MANTSISNLPSAVGVTGDAVFAIDNNSVTSKIKLSDLNSLGKGENIIRFGTIANLISSYNNGTAGVGATLTAQPPLSAFAPDGIVASVGDFILVKDQLPNIENGIYIVTTVGDVVVPWVLTRDPTYDSPAEILPGSFFTVYDGITNGLTQWIETETVVTVGTDPILFSSNVVAGNGLTKTTNILSLDTPVLMANGGTGSALVADNGGIVYTDADSMEILAATAIAGQIVMSSSLAAPVWSTPTYAFSYTPNNLLFSNGADTVEGLPTAVNGALVTDAAGAPSILAGPGATGRYISSNAAGAPTWSNFVPGEVNIFSIRFGTIANLLSTYANGAAGVGATLTAQAPFSAFSPDGFVASVGDLILVKDQTTTFENGFYTVTVVGDGVTAWVLTRSDLYDASIDIVPGGFFTVYEGSANGLTQWIETETVVNIGIDAILFSSNIVAGNGLTKTTNILALDAPILMANGGTGKSLVADNGGMVYTDGDSMEILASTITDGQIVMSSSSSAPIWSTPTYAFSYGNNNLLFSNGADTVEGLPTAVNGALVTDAAGAPSILAGPGATGRYISSNAAGAPTWSNFVPTEGEFHAPRFATTANLISLYSNGAAGVGANLTAQPPLSAFAPDGIVASVGDLVLVKDQAAPIQNGLYIVDIVGTGGIPWFLTRAIFYDEPAEILPGNFFTIYDGAVNALTQWIETETIVGVGADPILFSSNVVAGTGLAKTNNVIALDSTVTSGVFVPVLTNFLNITSSTAFQCQFMRVGSVATVSGQVDINATNQDLTILLMTLPIASVFVGFDNAGGTGVCGSQEGVSYGIQANIATGQVLFGGTLATAGPCSVNFSYTYVII